MTTNNKYWLFLIGFIPFFIGAQNDHSSHEVEHLTIWDTFFGNEEEFMVCYPKDHQSFFFAIIALSIVSLVMAIFIFYSYRKYNRNLKKISDLVQEKNAEILGSIRYAKRIQSTMLPTAEEFSNAISNGFVIYKPKDIVSGDFYWVYKEGNKKVIAVVDCTGHGVPGAFLSLIGFNALSRAVKEEHVMEPQRILHKMNDYVKQSLRQLAVGDMKDGMEASIVVYDDKTNVLEFSGARMNLIHYRNNEIQILRGSKLTVGTVEEHVVGPPTKEEMTIQNGDRIYMYSDGAVDQFGSGDKGKFKIKRLKELVERVGSKDMVEQEEVFNRSLDDWRGEEEQIDDITLIGVQF